MTTAEDTPGDKTVAIQTPTDNGDTITTFIAPWQTVGARGGKRLRVLLQNDDPDTFIAFGKDRSCTPSGTWFHLMRFALDVLSAKNTHQVVQHCEDVPPYLAIDPDNVPPILRHSRKDENEYGSTGKPYTFGADGETVLDGRHNQYAIGPDEETTWMEKRPDKVDGFKSTNQFGGSWWDMMCFAVNILNSPNTERLTREVDALPRRIYVADVQYDLSMMTPDQQPYRFRDGVPSNGSF